MPEIAAQARATGPGTRKAVLIPLAAGLAIGVIFVSIFLSAFHVPTPRDLPLGIVGKTHDVGAVTRTISETVPGAFDIVRFSTVDEARTALHHREVYGAYVISPANNSDQLLYAGANGPAVTATLVQSLAVAAQILQRTFTSSDVLPTSPGDTRGLSIFYTGFGLVLGGYLFGSPSFGAITLRSTKFCAMSISVDSSAITNRVCCKAPIGLPEATRSRT